MKGSNAGGAVRRWTDEQRAEVSRRLKEQWALKRDEMMARTYAGPAGRDHDGYSAQRVMSQKALPAGNIVFDDDPRAISIDSTPRGPAW